MKIFDKKKDEIVCQACGKAVEEGMRFCPQCGTEIVIPEPVIEEPEEEAFEASMFMHESDRIALKALKAIPGFTPLLKAFMSIWNERQYRIINLSSSIRLSEEQMPEIYNLLPPICVKLGIDVPELYLTLDPGSPNAWTSGDTKPFITINTGLLETIPERLIPTVLAHECGHIACHHVLYRTMGNIILGSTSSAASFLPFGLDKLISVPLQIAFSYWMRCSELSADRAAAYYNGGSDEIVEMCMRFAGFDKDVQSKGNVELFMQQAVEYKEMIKNNKWDKTLEFLLLKDQDHPFVSARAFECDKWCKTEEFKEIIEKYR